MLGLATGLLYVELDFADPAALPAGKVATDPRYVVVPALPSAISAFQASASEILSKIKRIDFTGLSEEVKALVAQTRRQVAGIDVRGTVEQWRRTGAALEALAADPAIRATLDELKTAASDVRAVMARLDGQLEPAGREVSQTMAEVRRSLQAFNTAAESVRGFMAAQSGVGADVGATLGRLNEAADAVARLAEFLERNPNALLTGRSRDR